MRTEIRQPNISGSTPEQQINQIRSYLYQLSEQLTAALSEIEGRTRSLYSPTGAELKGGEAEFEAVKPYIIKSNEIMSSYFNTLSKRFSGKYVSRKDFSTYVERTDLLLEASSEGIDQLYSRMENMDSVTQNMGSALTSVTAHIRSGYLCDDGEGNPVYGVEIGQTTEKDGEEIFNKFARFSAGRLTFYNDEGEELAHISGQRISVPGLEVGDKEMTAHVCGSLSLNGALGGKAIAFEGRRWSDGRLEGRGSVDLTDLCGELSEGKMLELSLALPSELQSPKGLFAFPRADLPVSISYDGQAGKLLLYSPMGAPTRLSVDISTEK